MFEIHDALDHRWFDSHRYALVDAVWREDLPIDWPLSVIAPDFLGQDTDRSPVLLDMQVLPRDAMGDLLTLLAQQVSERQDALCSLMLASPVGPEAMAAHLARRMVIRPAGAAAPQQFRFFDPGTFFQLPRLLGPRGMAWLLGPAETALVPWAGGWTLLHRPEPHTSTFALTARHVSALLRLGVVNRLAMQMAPPDNALAWEQTCAAIDDHVLRAMTAHGLQNQADLLAFAGHAMNCHPAFDRHPRLQEVWATLRAAKPDDELDYRELASCITPDEWQAMAADLQARDKTQAPLRATKEGVDP